MSCNIDSNFCGSFAWTIASYKLCFAALFMLTIQTTIFTVRPLAEKFKDSAFCPSNLVFPHYFYNKWCYSCQWL